MLEVLETKLASPKKQEKPRRAGPVQIALPTPRPPVRGRSARVETECVVSKSNSAGGKQLVVCSSVTCLIPCAITLACARLSANATTQVIIHYELSVHIICTSYITHT